MNNKFITDIDNQIQYIMKDDLFRYRHTIGVADTCACLAMRYSINMERAYIAGLLHDCAKCMSDEKLIDECRNNNICISEYESAAPYLLHGKVGALYAKERFNITDDEIITAICCHTTGKPGMTTLEEILFVADYIEPMRNKADKLDIIRNASFSDLKLAVYMICDNTLTYLKNKNTAIDKTTVLTYEYYKKYMLKGITDNE